MNIRHNSPVSAAEFHEIYTKTRAEMPKKPLRVVYEATEQMITALHGRRKYRNWQVYRSVATRRQKQARQQ